MKPVDPEREKSPDAIELDCPLLTNDVLNTFPQRPLIYPTKISSVKAHIFKTDEKELIYHIIDPKSTTNPESDGDSAAGGIVKKIRERLWSTTTESITGLSSDPNIEQVTIDSKNIIWVYHRNFGLIKTDFKMTENEINYIISAAQQNLKEGFSASREFDGIPVEVIKLRTCQQEYTVTLTKVLRDNPPSIINYLDHEMLSVSMAALLWRFIEHKVNILILGDDQFQNELFLDSLTDFLYSGKIISLGPFSRSFQHVPIIELCTKSVTEEELSKKKHLFSSACTVIGKNLRIDQVPAITRSTSFPLLVSLHPSRQLLARLSNCISESSGISLVHTDDALTELLSRFDVVINLCTTGTKEKPAWRVKSLLEIVEIDSSASQLIYNILYERNPFEDTFRFSGRSFLLEEIQRTGMDFVEILKDVQNRKIILEHLLDNNMYSYQEVSHAVLEFVRSLET